MSKRGLILRCTDELLLYLQSIDSDPTDILRGFDAVAWRDEFRDATCYKLRHPNLPEKYEVPEAGEYTIVDFPDFKDEVDRLRRQTTELKQGWR